MVGLLVAVLSALMGAVMGAAQTPGSERDAAWEDDFRVLSKALSPRGPAADFKRVISPLGQRGQKDFSKLYPNFEVDILSLQTDLPKLEDSEIVLRLMKIIASANVAHNTVQPPMGMGFYARLPLQFAWYPDGMVVSAASREYAQALGTHVVKIGDKTPEEVLAGIAPYVPHENDAELKEDGMSLLRPQAILKHLGLLNAEGKTVLTLRKPGGNPFQLAVLPGNPKAITVAAADTLHLRPSLAQSRPGEFYWQRYLDDSKTLYVQYNRCANDPKLPFHRFVNDLIAEADLHEGARVVLDLRFNAGGDSRVILPLRTALEQRLSKLGQIYVLIGSGTMGSAVDNASEFKSFEHAILVGEPSGGTASSYGDAKYLTLPNSKLVVQYTSKWFGTKGNEAPEALKPDVTVPRSFDDILTGRDSVLEAALAAK
jgi:hypothetical protein